MEGRAAELAEQSRAWYRTNGRPWIYARQADCLELTDDAVRIEGAAFSGGRLRDVWRRGEAHGAALACVSAGPELEYEAQRHWREDRPDEYFFLEALGSAVAEHLVTLAGARLCAWAESLKMAVLPHQSPGYADWDVAEQPVLLSLLRPPGAIEALDSGMLRPKKSLLAAFGITRKLNADRPGNLLQACAGCSLPGCGFRRAPYRRYALPDPEAQYLVNPKALRRWSQERLRLEALPGGAWLATFQYEGTTCSNLGRPLEFNYRVILGPRAEGYRIVDQSCAPAERDTGHRFMCEYLRRGDALIADVAGDKPLLGEPLNDVLSWRRQSNPAGCYCDPEARQHKWGLVLETIHYALVQMEKRSQNQ